MYKLTEVPLPPASHYVGILFLFEVDGVQHMLMTKDHDIMRGRVNNKLPGGKNDEKFRKYMVYENTLFDDILIKLKFTKEAKKKIYRNEQERRKQIVAHKGHEPMVFVLRTLVLKSLANLGYYPMDIEPNIVAYTEKDEHTQYFIEVKTFIDAEGNEVKLPTMEDGFKSLDPNLVETRVPLKLSSYKKLIFSHEKAAEKFFLTYKKAGEKADEIDDEDDLD